MNEKEIFTTTMPMASINSGCTGRGQKSDRPRTCCCNSRPDLLLIPAHLYQMHNTVLMFKHLVTRNFLAAAQTAHAYRQSLPQRQQVPLPSAHSAYSPAHVQSNSNYHLHDLSARKNSICLPVQANTGGDSAMMSVFQSPVSTSMMCTPLSAKSIASSNQLMRSRLAGESPTSLMQNFSLFSPARNHNMHHSNMHDLVSPMNFPSSSRSVHRQALDNYLATPQQNKRSRSRDHSVGGNDGKSFISPNMRSKVKARHHSPVANNSLHLMSSNGHLGMDFHPSSSASSSPLAPRHFASATSTSNPNDLLYNLHATTCM